MSPRRMLTLLVLALATMQPLSLAAQDVTPDGGSLTAPPNATGQTAAFWVNNNESYSQNFSLSCDYDSAVTSCSVQGSVTVSGFGSEQVYVTFSTGASGVGTVSLKLDYAILPDGWYNVTVGRAPPTLDVTPHNGENRSMALCAGGCFDAVASYTTPAYVSMDTPRSLTLLYRSAYAIPWVTVQVDATDPSPGDPATAMSIRLKRPDGSWVQFRDGTSEVFFTRAAGPNRLAAQFDATGLATGRHNYTVVVRSHWSGATMETSQAIKVLVVNEWLNSWAPAPGWSIAGLQKVWDYGTDGIVITEGDGSILRFPRSTCYTGFCTYNSPKGDFTTVIRMTLNGAVQRKYPDGTLLEFTSTGDLSYSQDRFGNRTNYSYGTNRRLTQVTDPAGKSLALAYNGNGKLSTITDPGGRVTTLEYDGAGNVYRILRPDGVAAMTLAWGFWGGPYRLNEQSDAIGGVWTFAYDFAGKLATQTLPQVAINGVAERPVMGFASLESRVLSSLATSYTSRAVARNPDTLRASTTNPRGYTTSYKLDRFGSPLRVEEPLGRTTVIARNVESQPTQITSPAGFDSYFTWSGASLTRVYDFSLGRSIYYRYETTYNQPDSVWGTTTPVRNFWSGGKLDSSRVGQAAALSRFTYDSRGRIKTAGDPKAHGTEHFYATSGWQNTDSVKTGSRKTAYGYDSWGRTSTVADPLNQISVSAYDSLNRVRLTVGPMNDTTRYAYNNVFLTTVTDALGQEFGYVPNVLGWLEQRIDPRGNTDQYQYDRNGNLTRWTDRRDSLVTATYDDLDQLRSRTADGDTTSYWGDPLGRFAAVANGESTDTLWRDRSGRDSIEITVRSGARVYRLTSSYNVRNMRTQVEMSGPVGWTSTVGYRYDVFLGLDTLIDVAGGRTRITYDMDRQPDGWTLPMGVAIESAYSSTHMLGKVRYPSHAALDTAVGVNYGYDDLSRVRERLSFNMKQGRGYTRDALGRLTHDTAFYYLPGTQECTPIYEDNQIYSEDPPIRYDCTSESNKVIDTVRTRTFSYDLVGNRTDLSAVTDTGNRLVSFNGYTLEYDAAGHLTRKQHTGMPDQTFEWNSLGQLVSVTSNGDTTSFGYDGWGRRVRKSDGLSVKHYVHDGDDLFAELDSSYAVQAEYTYYPGVDRPHSVRRAGSMYYYVTDHPGNVVGLVDSAGTLRNEYRYDAFGLSEYTSETIANGLAYAARELDSETGLYFNRARYYDPGLGRFISEDPIGLEGGINVYAYADNDPISNVDPYGLECVRWGPWELVLITEDVTIYERRCEVEGLATVIISEKAPINPVYTPSDFAGLGPSKNYTPGDWLTIGFAVSTPTLGPRSPSTLLAVDCGPVTVSCTTSSWIGGPALPTVGVTVTILFNPMETDYNRAACFGSKAFGACANFQDRVLRGLTVAYGRGVSSPVTGWQKVW